DGRRSVRSMHDQASWERLLDRIDADREQRVRTGRSQVVPPFDIVRLDLDDRTDGYVGDELYKAHGFGSGVTLESADYLLRFRPELEVDRIAPRPLLLIHGTHNRLHPVTESEELHRRAADPKELVLLDGAGHTEWMFDDHPLFRSVADRIEGFLSASLPTADGDHLTPHGVSCA
ncbi:MAG: alpha/beta hydrolase, partial [Acidimicrobiales bacterium]